MRKGQLSGHTPKMFKSRTLTAHEIFQCLYVDDGAFPFDSRESLEKGMTLIFHHFAKFGLQMHIGRNGEMSKTECVFFPPPQFFKHRRTPRIMESRRQTRSMTRSTNNPTTEDAPTLEDDDEQNDQQRENEGEVYDALEETKKIEVADGYVTFTRSFKYLGLAISYNLRDDDDVCARIAAANASMGALKDVWRNPHLDVYSKYLLFRAIPMNLLLWGCETWSMRQTLLNKLEIFMHRSIRRILDISMSQVKDERIRNENIRKIFYDIPIVENMIAARQLDFIGKAIRAPPDRPSRIMLTACCNNQRRVGRPQLHNKNFIVRNLKLLFSRIPTTNIDRHGSLKDWIHEASNEKYWNGLIECLLHSDAPLPERPEEWGPLPRRSSRHRPPPPPQHPTPPPSPRRRQDDRDHGEEAQEPPAGDEPPPRRPPPPRSPQQQLPREGDSATDEFDPRRWLDNEELAEMVSRSMCHALKIFGLGLGASETEQKVRYRQMARFYHPDMRNETQGSPWKKPRNSSSY